MQWSEILVMRRFSRGFRLRKSTVALDEIRYQYQFTDQCACKDVELCSTRHQPIDDPWLPSRAASKSVP